MKKYAPRAATVTQVLLPQAGRAGVRHCLVMVTTIHDAAVMATLVRPTYSKKQ